MHDTNAGNVADDHRGAPHRWPSAMPMPPSDQARPPLTDSRRRLPRWVTPTARIAGTVALLAFALRGIDWPTFLELLETVDWRWWGVGLALSFAVNLLASIRWAALARPIGFDLPLQAFVRRFFEGQFFSLCLPTSIGGDVVKAYRLADTTQGRVLAGCTILTDRLCGLAALGILAFTALTSKQFNLPILATVAAGTFLLGTVILVVRWAIGHLDWIAARLPQGHAVQRVVARLLPYQQRPWLVTSAVAWSLLVQMGGALVVACIGRSVGAVLPLTFWFVAVPLLALAMILPLSIGGVGVREGGLALLLAPEGVAAEKAVAIGLLWFLSTIVCGLAGGVMFLAAREPKPRPPSPQTAAAD